MVAWTLGAWWINPELGDHRSRDHTMLYLGMGWPLFQLKSGRTSASRLPQARQTNCAAMSDERTSSGRGSPLIATEWLQR